MAIATGERSFHKTQLGYEVTEGTGVAATLLFPAESASIIELDRAPDSPEEDYGELAMAQPGRSVFGVRQATLPLRGTVRFEDIIRILQSAIAGGVTPTGSDPYTWTFTMDNTSDTLDSMTLEDGDQIAAYEMVGSFVQSLRLSFDAVAPGGAAPWTFEATVIGRNKEATTFTGAVTAPANMETAMGHLTRLYFDTAATAFASLSELPGSLLSFEVAIETGIVLRKQGGEDDEPDGHGRGKASATFTALVEQIAGTKTAFWDAFEVGNPVIPSKRMRVQVTGGGLNTDETVFIAHGGTAVATGGTFALIFGGDTTLPIDWNASAAVVQANLQALASIGPGNVSVSGDYLTGWVVRFMNALGATDVGAITSDDTLLTGGTAPTIEETVQKTGASAANKSITIDGQVNVDQVPVEEGDGSSRYSVQGRYVKDATLASTLQIVVNGVAA